MIGWMDEPKRAAEPDDDAGVALDKRYLSVRFEGRTTMFESPEERAAKTWNLTIELWGGDDDDPAQIGSGRATVIDLDEPRRAGSDAIELLDMVSSEAEHLSVVYDAVSNDWRDDLALEMPTSRALFVESMELEAGYRGHGVGPLVLAIVVDRLRGGCGFAALEPSAIGDPLYGRTADEARVSLGRLWEQVGFVPYRDGVWILDLATTVFDDRLAALLPG